ncbi:MAG TPA: hypothetical protein VMZ53_32145 [Kofleriaceae bacterium]|nr:hypothetical protein [Kofleriaceae bacterium]
MIRFLLGGVVVSAFAAAGELFKPKTFSGLFGAAPSVAIASLALAFHAHGANYVRTEAKSMLIGSAAMLLYTIACIVVAKRDSIPVWLAAGLAWIAWFAAAFALFALARSGGLA